MQIFVLISLGSDSSKIFSFKGVGIIVSCYVVQHNLLVPFDVKPSWDCYKIEGATVGIHGGVSIKLT